MFAKANPKADGGLPGTVERIEEAGMLRVEVAADAVVGERGVGTGDKEGGAADDFPYPRRELKTLDIAINNRVDELSQGNQGGIPLVLNRANEVNRLPIEFSSFS